MGLCPWTPLRPRGPVVRKHALGVTRVQGAEPHGLTPYGGTELAGTCPGGVAIGRGAGAPGAPCKTTPPP